MLIDLHSRPRTPSHPPPGELFLISLLDKVALWPALALEGWRGGDKLAGAEMGACVPLGRYLDPRRERESRPQCFRPTRRPLSQDRPFRLTVRSAPDSAESRPLFQTGCGVTNPTKLWAQ